MAKFHVPAGIDIPALDHPERQQEHINVLAPGGGTPWEDRGHLGSLKGFVLTCVMTLVRPVSLFNSIRRPDSTSETTGFALGCGVVWLFGMVSQAAFAWWRLKAREAALQGTKDALSIDSNIFLFTWTVAAIVMPVGVILLVKLITLLFHKLVSSGTDPARRRPPRELVFNVFAYALGPCILAFIPVFGPWVAAAWTLGLMLLGAVTRLHAGVSNSLVCGLISQAAAAAVALGLFYAARFAFSLNGWAIEQKAPDRVPRVLDRSTAAAPVRDAYRAHLGPEAKTQPTPLPPTVSMRLTVVPGTREQGSGGGDSTPRPSMASLTISTSRRPIS